MVTDYREPEISPSASAHLVLNGNLQMRYNTSSIHKKYKEVPDNYPGDTRYLGSSSTN